MTQYKLQFNAPEDKEAGGAIKVHFGEVHLGDLIKDVDGYYYFWPLPRKYPGAWSAHIMETIATKLYDLNKAWDREVVKGFKKLKKGKILLHAETISPDTQEPMPHIDGMGLNNGVAEEHAKPASGEKVVG